MGWCYSILGLEEMIISPDYQINIVIHGLNILNQTQLPKVVFSNSEY